MIDLFLPQQRRMAYDTPSYRTVFLEGRDLVEILGLPTASKVNVTEETSLTYSAVWAATRLLAGTGGWLPLNLYRRVSDRENRIARDDSRNDMISVRPNTEMDSMPFRAMGIMQQVNGGNAYAEVERDRRGTAINLWPIHANRVLRVRDQEGDIFYRVNNNDAGPSFIPAADMVHVPSMMTYNGIDGLGVVRFARESIGMGLVTERQGAAHFGNGGIPQLVVKHKAKFQEPGRSLFRKEWHEMHGGDGTQGKSNIAILDQDADIHTLTLSPEDNQYLSTREHNINEIARWYGVPPHMIGDLRRATFSNIEHMGIEFVVFSLIPWLKLWEQQLSTKLLTAGERATLFFEFNVNALLRGDAQTRANYYQAMVNNGMMSRNEARRLENLPPYEGGDEFFLQGAMVPVRTLLAKADAEEAAAKAAVENPQAIESEEVAPPEEPPKKPPQERSERDIAILHAARALFFGAINRIIRKESCEARHASCKSAGFLQWLDDFYGEKHAAGYREAIAPVCQALQSLGYSVAADEFVNTQMQISKNELLDLSGQCGAADLQNKIHAHVSVWEHHRAAKVVESIIPIGDLACGGKGSGRPGPCPLHGNRIKEKNPSEKSIRAKAAHVLVDSRIQRYSEEHNEPRLAKKLKGKSEPDNKAYDIAITDAKGKMAHGVELKTMVSNGNDKITMKGSAQDRKIAWEKDNKATFHTVVFDDRKVYNAHGEGKHGSESDRVILYRRGGGSFRTGTMHKVKDYAELNKLINSKDSDLPAAARATSQWKARQAAAGVTSR